MFAVSTLATVSLGDMVRGLRANKKNESKYISEQVQLIREELRMRDMAHKSNALEKLIYVCPKFLSGRKSVYLVMSTYLST